MNTSKKLVVGYCRAASANEPQITRQKKALREIAKKRNLRITRFYVDNGYSGATLERPEFEHLLNDCRSRKIDTVLVTTVDRIARANCLVADALWAFGRYNVRLQVGDGDGLKFFRILHRAIADMENSQGI